VFSLDELLVKFSKGLGMVKSEQEEKEREDPIEIAIVGDLTEHEAELTQQLLGVPRGGECTLFFDSPGGSPYCAMSLMSLILLRNLKATGVVTGECSSATLWVFASCCKRFVTPFSVLLFHPMKWQSEEHIGLSEAAEWARHFGHLETEMDSMLAELLQVDMQSISSWITPGRYVSGREFSEAGFANLIKFQELPSFSVSKDHSADNKLVAGKTGDNGNGAQTVAKRVKS
jgi:ATP-dependent protease ClpP protease subunit